MKEFKSERAAKTAYTKQRKVWDAARDARIDAAHKRGEPTTTQRAELDRLRTTFEGLTSDARYDSSAWHAHCALWNAITDRPREEAQKQEDVEHEKLRAIYNQAKSQKFSCGWYGEYDFGVNVTRDLIAQNID